MSINPVQVDTTGYGTSQVHLLYPTNKPGHQRYNIRNTIIDDIEAKMILPLFKHTSKHNLLLRTKT
jgi:hypothetical protein